MSGLLLTIENTINAIPHLPEYIKIALFKSILIIPFIYIIATVIEIFEQFILSNMSKLTALYKRIGVPVGTLLAAIPECGVANITAILYSRRLASAGTMFAVLIMCSDDALPLLFLDPSKIVTIIPILLIKAALALAIGFTVDILGFLNPKSKLDRDQALMLQIHDRGCCFHSMDSEGQSNHWTVHAFSHTLNTFMFSLIILSVLYAIILHFGDATTAANALHFNTLFSVFLIAAIGLIPNCFVSMIIALLYVTGLISFGPFVAGLITINGLALGKLKKYAGPNTGKLFALIIYALAVIVGGYLFLI